MKLTTKQLKQLIKEELADEHSFDRSKVNQILMPFANKNTEAWTLEELREAMLSLMVLFS